MLSGDFPCSSLPSSGQANNPVRADLEARKKRLQRPGAFLNSRVDVNSSGSYRPDTAP